jgi:hypothetical protein
LGRQVEGVEQAEKRGEPDLALAALDPRYLNGGEPGLGG